MARWQADQHSDRSALYDPHERRGPAPLQDQYQPHEHLYGQQHGQYQQQQQQQQQGTQPPYTPYHPQQPQHASSPYPYPYPNPHQYPQKSQQSPHYPPPHSAWQQPAWSPPLPPDPSYYNPAFHQPQQHWGAFQPSWPAFQQGGGWNQGGGGWTGGGDSSSGGRDAGGGNGYDNQWSTGEYRQPRARYDGQPGPSSHYNPHHSSNGYDPSRPPRLSSPNRRSRSPTHAPSYSPRGSAPTTDQGYSSAPRYSAQGEYIAPQRRVKKDQRTAPIPEPTEGYLAASQLPSETTPVEAVDSLKDEETLPQPPIVILDLNHTLLCRAKRTSWGSKQPLVRPYLATFLSYLCSSSSPPSASSNADTSSPRRPRFQPIVYSSARSSNVLSMLTALNLIPLSRLPPPFDGPSNAPLYNYVPFSPPPYSPSPAEGDVLKMVFTREMMGLSKRDYDGDVDTTKDLGRVWEELGMGGLRAWKEEQAKLIEADEKDAAALQREEERNPDELVISDEESGVEHSLPSKPAGGDKVKRSKKPNKKGRARFDAERDEQGARRTLLLDDEASKSAQQPYSHLPILPFIVHPAEYPPPVMPTGFSSAPPSPSGRRRSPPPSVPPPVAALELPPSSSAAAAGDTHLLSTIYLLERLRCESNVSAVLRAGFIAQVREKVKAELPSGEANEREIDEALAQRGREVCGRYEIEVSERWDGRWREKVLEKEGRSVGV